jgi:hypothetical protein
MWLEPSKTDTSSIVHLRHFDLQKLKEYAGQQDFQYNELAPVDTDWWGRFWRWFWQLFYDAIGDGPSSRIIGYIALGILVALAIFIILKVIGVDLKIFSGKSKAIDIPYLAVEDNIHEINFNEEIEKAIATGNFRLAVRLFYLRVLKQLSDAGQIVWQPEKTNQTYIAEITDAARQSNFKKLTNQFEYVWYGEFSLNKAQFEDIKSGFENFKPRGS